MPPVSFRVIAGSSALALALSTTPMTAGLALEQTIVPLQLAQYQVLEVEPETANAPEVAPLPENNVAVESGEPFDWQITSSQAGLQVTGYIPALAFAQFLAIRAPGLMDETEVREGAPEGFVLDALAALEAVRMLSSGGAGLVDGTWFVSGTLAAPYDQAALQAALAQGYTAPQDWALKLDLPDVPLDEALPESTSLEAEPKPETPPQPVEQSPEPPEPVDPTDEATPPVAVSLPDEPEIPAEVAVAADESSSSDVCRERVEAYMADKAILFASASFVPTPQSLEILPELAQYLELCPETVIYVEGHTDADGLAEANLTLSIRRAEAVVDALIDLGISPRRLYAVGYGQSLPIAPNTTADGKRQNRRIVFSFEDIATPIE